jgi:hypothetical protein
VVLNDVIIGLAERFRLDPLRIGRPEAFEAAINAAVALMPAQALIDEVAAMGGLGGARQPWGVVLARLRRIAELAGESAVLAEGQVVQAARSWGARLGAMVRASSLHIDGAASELASETDPVLRQVALDAFGHALVAAPEPAGVTR